MVADQMLDGRSLSAALIATGCGRPYSGGRRGSWCDQRITADRRRVRLDFRLEPSQVQVATHGGIGVAPVLSAVCLLLKPVVRHLKFVDHLYRLTACPHGLPMRLQFSIRLTSLLF